MLVPTPLFSQFRYVYTNGNRPPTSADRSFARLHISEADLCSQLWGEAAVWQHRHPSDASPRHSHIPVVPQVPPWGVPRS